MFNWRDSTRLSIAALVFMSFVLAPSEQSPSLLLQSRPKCSSYEVLIISSKICVARCPVSCGSGLCTSEGKCTCEDGYSPSISDGLICTPDCIDGCRRAGGICAGTELCLCPKGKTFNSVLKRCIWQPYWSDPCKGQCRYGACSNAGVCTCGNGYEFNTTATANDQLCNPRCEKNCGPNAYCYLPDMCACSRKNSHYDADGICSP